MAVNHLIKLGRKKTLLIHGPKGHYFTKQMLAGYMETLVDNDIDFDPRLVLSGDFHIKGGYAAVKHALEEKIDFDSIFANDEMACGALQALHEADIAVPDKVSVVGFDGLIAGEAASPPLTTVLVDRHEMGRMAVRRLLDMEEKSERFSDYIKLSLFPRLIVRQSCGAGKVSSITD
jgi:LacI family transcriptional regulator